MSIFDRLQEIERKQDANWETLLDDIRILIARLNNIDEALRHIAAAIGGETEHNVAASLNLTLGSPEPN